MKADRMRVDPFTTANPNEFDPFARATTHPAPFVARTPVPADHPLLGRPRHPWITPATAAAAEALGYDPEAVNAPLIKRFGAVFVDAAVYGVLLAVLMVIAGVFGPADAAPTVAVAALFAGPAGFYLYRAMGDAIFEGSPGKHALGLHMGGPNGLPVSGTDGLRRNLWILPSMIPGLGWIVSLAMMGWIGLSAGNDPLGRGGHERAIGTRVTEKD